MDKKVVIATHDGMFHADDVFAVAALLIMLDRTPVVTAIVRTRGIEDVRKADFVVDVGSLYLPDKNRFDHHQIGGAGARANGIPYASFGLVWQKYGEEIAGGAAEANTVERILVTPVDADDSGTDIFNKIFPDVVPYAVSDLIHDLRPTWQEPQQSISERFLEAVGFARKVLERTIAHAKAAVAAETALRAAYYDASDKRYIVLPIFYPYEKTLASFPEPLFAVFPRSDGMWAVKTIRDDPSSFKNRKDLPESWAGKRDKGLAEITGVPDAIFSHANRFMAVAKSKEGAIALAEKAIES